MQPIYMPTPDENLWKKVAEEFQDRWNFPHCIGTIDGKHVEIQALPNSGSTFYNYKKYFSTVLLGLVDSQYRFIAIDTGSYGKECDSTIFSESAMGKRLTSYSFALPKDEPLVEGGVSLPYVVMGDEGFPLKRFIMRPFPKDKLTNERRIFNYRICRCRRVVENAFGILAHRWRLYFRPLQCEIDTVQKIIKATTVLHNYLCSKGDITTVRTEEEIAEANKNCWKPLNRSRLREGKDAIEIRNHFVQYFNSEHGSVPWQWQHL
ncbi:uncharacterized protein LOC120355158 [Nilaparvata lugens]|uniref:uncharacterized protein LOC120355158 n=1 Tax=Nilaparvata lugens TaxID=108931 RepID=UPI00193CC443|nr:uncharacterized protein LOC120355158 [Nilaparvata lugens]